MARSLDIFLKTTLPRDTVEEALRRGIGERSARADEFWVSLQPAGREAQEDCESEYGLKPTLEGSIRPPAGDGGAAAYGAALALAQRPPGIDLVIAIDGTPTLTFREGIARARAEDRDFFEVDVMAGESARLPFEWESPAESAEVANPTRSAGTAKAVEDSYATPYSLYSATRNDPMLAGLLMRRGRAFEEVRARGRAREDFERARELYRGLGDERGEATALVHLGGSAHSAGDLRGATAAYDEALRLYDRLGDDRGRADAYAGRGALWSIGREPSDCLDDLNQALQRFYALPSTDGVAGALLQRAGLEARRGIHPGFADQDYREAARLFASIGDPREREARAGLAGLRGSASSAGVDSADPWDRAETFMAQARRKQEAGDLDGAIEYLGQAIDVFESAGEAGGQGNALSSRARVWIAMGQLDRADEDLDRALSLYQQEGAVLGEANVSDARGDLWLARRDLERARGAYAQALTLFEQVGDSIGVANSHAELARVALALGDLDAARTHADQALDLGAGTSDYAVTTAREVLGSLDA